MKGGSRACNRKPRETVAATWTRACQAAKEREAAKEQLKKVEAACQDEKQVCACIHCLSARKMRYAEHQPEHCCFQETFGHDKGQKSAISAHHLYWCFLILSCGIFAGFSRFSVWFRKNSSITRESPENCQKTKIKAEKIA